MSVRHIVSSMTLLWALAVLLATVTTPAVAHKEHKKQPVAAKVAPAPHANQPAAAGSDPDVIHARIGEMTEKSEERAPMTTIERLVDWLGRLHPMIVHFPIAFFPAALFTAIVGRHRPAFGTPVRFLVVAGGILAPIAALLGWFDGGFNFAADDALLQPHRWLGTAIGAFALGLGIWAWRRPDQGPGPAMIAGLTIMTVAIVVQGWFGGALVHGIDHMNW